MSTRLKFFFIALLISIPFWLGINVFQENLENFFYQREITTSPYLLASIAYQAELEEKLEQMKPVRNKHYDNLEITAKSAISVFVDEERRKEKILFEKNTDEKLPIASLTKLMTVYVALKNYNFSEEMKNSLYLTLIESNNEATLNLVQVMGEKTFVDLMNLEAQYLGLENTHFINPTGLDNKDSFNYSTVQDLAKFAKYLTAKNPSIWEISIVPEFKNTSNTNRLLGEISGIIGGKTGETPKSGGCLLLVVQTPKNKGYIVNVILNSENRFEEMKKLIDWIQYAYRW